MDTTPVVESGKFCADIALSTSNIGDIFTWVTCLLNQLMPILIMIASLGFVWGVIQFYLNPNSEDKKKKGKEFMLWGLIALFVIVSMWGLVGIIANTFGVKVMVPQLSNEQPYTNSNNEVPVFDNTGTDNVFNEGVDSTIEEPVFDNTEPNDVFDPVS